MTIAVVAEKPSVGRDLARVLGADKRGDGYLAGNGYVVTWAIGHLVALAEPHEMNPAWKQWRPDLLPILPDRWLLSVLPSTKGQYESVARILADRRITEIVCATDAGREGELIFRYLLERSGVQKPVKRLWLSSLTDDAIKQAFSRLKSSSEYDGLADAARGRSRADWLVGMNLSRAYTLSSGADMVSVGRVQTPTLAMVVARELAIRAFVAEPYVELVATFALPPPAGAATGEGEPPGGATYTGRWERPEGQGSSPREKGSKPPSLEDRRRLPVGELSQAIAQRVRKGRAVVADVIGEKDRSPAPLLYDLTELQRHANRLFGFSAQKTLDLAQALYEEHKLLSYPRTDSRHLSQDVAMTLPAIVAAVRHPYEASLEVDPTGRSLGSRYVDDAKVTDHHALLPTSKRSGKLPPDLEKIYDLVCRRLLQAFQPDHETATTVVFTDVTSKGAASAEALEQGGGSGAPGVVVDRFRTTGTLVLREGWKRLDRKLSDKRQAEEPLPAGLARALAVEVKGVKAESKMTKPPPRYTEATLLTAMETAGRTLEDKELSLAMKDRGLGTPATRAATIETLLRREYIGRDKQLLVATDKGVGVIGMMHEEVKSPVMTGEWEADLAKIQRGEGTLEAFLQGIQTHVASIVRKVLSDGPTGTPMRPPRSAPTLTTTTIARGSYAGSSNSPPRRSASRGASAPPADGFRGDEDDTPPDDYVPDYGASDDPTAASSPAPDDDRWLDEDVGGGPDPDPPSSAPRSRSPASLDRPSAPSAPPARRPLEPGASFDVILRERFGFPGFRPYQEAVCTAVREGQDTLLVMPTGAGKSLCYQLPAVARGGTALVVSPLIALMEDQVEKLRRAGFAAERIHSGRGRDEARNTSRAYLAGELDFLFIAPERLRVPGFPEMIAKRELSLVAIDEAHCISRWGHDFRPEYRMLGQRLPQMHRGPVIAVTATATQVVQDDIVGQLGLRSARRFIHGFRRDNLALVR